MTVRTKTALRQLIIDTLEDDGENTAVEVRTILTDWIDSGATQIDLDALTARVVALEFV